MTIQGLVVGSPLLVVGSPLRCACLMCVVCSSSVIFPTVSYCIREHSAAMPRARASREQPPSTAARNASFIASVAQAPPRARRIASFAGAAAGIAAARQCSASAALQGDGGPDGSPIISLCAGSKHSTGGRRDEEDGKL